jgi:shikimate dehydrogenase
MDEHPSAFVCGHPIAHSRSPIIHGWWLAQHGLKGSYRAIDVAPQDLPAFLAEIRAGAYAGGNVTVPHKEAAFRSVDRLDAAAEAIGAVNTLWMEDGRLCGGNTDAYGFVANLDDRLPGWDGADGIAMVLGAGGASRAVLHALTGRGFRDIRIVNRTRERAERLASAFGSSFSALALDRAEDAMRDVSLLVNTTSAGMHDEPALELGLDALRPDAVVTDIVYVPLETPLLRAARARGLRTVDGLGMLLHQAVPGFERWFGVRPSVTPDLRALIEADLGVHA